MLLNLPENAAFSIGMALASESGRTHDPALLVLAAT
jgi:hypothetical protein